MRGGLLTAALAALAAAAWAGEGAQTDGEAWNAGVDSYRAGDVTNALRILRPLMLSRTHGARAAEAVAKLEMDRGNREEAAAAAQIALRAHPDDPRAGRNFTRAVDGLPAARAAKHVDEVLRQAKGRDPGGMMQAATREVRALMDESAGYRTNRAERVVALADALSRRASALADTWIPVRETIVQSVTNEEQASAVLLQVQGAETKTRRAAEALADLDDSGYGTLADVEQDFTRFFKMTALPPAAIDEDLVAQSNAWQALEPFNGRDWQAEALDFTRAFRAKFPAWARACEQQAQADTNRPPFTAEAQAKISALATELEKIQLECTEKHLPPEQEKAVGIIIEIRDLLPKDPNGGQQGQPQQNQGSRQKDQQKEQQKDQQQDQQQQDQQQDPGEEPKDDQDGSDGDEDDGKGEEDQEVEAVLKAAQERNDEHEEEKKARMRRARLPPNERDW